MKSFYTNFSKYVGILLLTMLAVSPAWADDTKTVIFSEDFSSLTTGSNTDTNGSNTKVTSLDGFSSFTNIYPAKGAIKFGTGKAAGSITTNALDLSVNNGEIHVAFDVKGWSEVEGDLKVTVGDSNSETVTYTATISNDFESKDLTFTGCTSNMKITFETTAKRAFLDNIEVYYLTAGGGEEDTRTQVQLAFSEESYTYTEGTWAAPVLTTTPTIDMSNVSFSLDVEGIVQVNADGEIELVADHGFGTVVVTASIDAENELYKQSGADATCTIIVKDPNQTTFTAQLGSFSTVSGTVDDNISYEASKGDATTTPAVYDNEIRLYKATNNTVTGGVFTVTAAEGYYITDVDFIFGSSKSGTINCLVDNTAYKSGVSIDKNDTSTLTYTVSGINAQSVSIVNASSGDRIDLAGVKVTYAKAITTTDPTIQAAATVNFGTTLSTFEAQTLEVKGYNLTEAITYSLSEAAPFTVSGTLTEEGGTLTVTCTATEVGTYTATLTLSATGAESVEVALTAEVTTLPGEGDGTCLNPYNIARVQALFAYNLFDAEAEVYVKGTVAGTPDVNTTYGNATYYLSDDGTETDKFYIFRSYFQGGAQFTDTKQLAEGCKVVVKGKLTLYNTTPEMTSGGSIFSITYPTDVVVTFNQDGMSTLYYGDRNLQLPSGVEAYIYTYLEEGEDAGIIDTKVLAADDQNYVDIIPAGYAVLLYRPAGAGVETLTKVDAADMSITDLEEYYEAENSLVGTDINKVNDQTGTKPYVFAYAKMPDMTEAALGFWRVSNSYPIPAHKAYLLVQDGQSARGFQVGFDEPEVTAIAAVPTTTTNESIYTIAGQRVARATKGVYIVNGKKVIK